MPDNTIEWGQGAVNNTNDWGKAKANATNNFGAVYDDSPSLDTNITGSTGAVLSISYSSSAFCEDASDPTPTVSNNVGAGTFSSTAGLVFVSTSTGEVDISASTSGATYLITYTDTNSATATFSLTINDLDDASFAYSQSSYAPTDADPTPTPVLAGGTFSAGSGLVFVDSGSNTGSSTGEIDLSASTIASYTITYTTAGTCPNTSTQSVEIAAALAQVSNVYSMEFDGASTTNVNVGNMTAIQGASTFSISAWINVDSIGQQRIFGSWNYSASKRIAGFGIYTNNKLLLQISKDGASFDQLFSTTTLTTTGSWIHVAVTFSNGDAEFYINGNSAGSDTSSTVSNIYNISNDYFIGSFNVSTNFPFNGKLDEVAVFNTALTAQEVQDIYNATETGKTADLNDLTTPPIKWYRMGD